MKRIITVVVISVSLAGGIAHAECDGPPPVTGSAHQRLDIARNAIEQGRNGYAFRVAHSIPELDDATQAEIGEARAITALVYWKNGDVKRADSELATAKKANEPAAQKFVASIKDETIRKVFGAELEKISTADVAVARVSRRKD